MPNNPLISGSMDSLGREAGMPSGRTNRPLSYFSGMTPPDREAQRERFEEEHPSEEQQHQDWVDDQIHAENAGAYDEDQSHP